MYDIDRAIKYCSNWDALHVEINRIKQVLINNKFTLCIIDADDRPIVKLQQNKFH